MSNRTGTFTLDRSSSKVWQAGLWLAQIALCLMFGMVGVIKLTAAPEAMASMGIAWATDVPLALVRFIGACEMAGAIGLILPALSRIQPWLTPLAALGLLTIQVLALGFHAMRGELATTGRANVFLIILTAFVAWGRTRKVPIAPRS